jgi:hypothetical protein
MPMATTKAFGGRALINFNEAKHFYSVTVPGTTIRNLYQPSVTGIIGMKDKSGALVPWAVGQMTERVKTLLGEGDETWDRETLLAVLETAQETWRNERQKAADIGSLAHRVLEARLLGSSITLPITADSLLAPNLTPEMVKLANNAISAGLRYLDEHSVRVIQAEAPRWSPTYGFIGTGDLIAEIDGKLSILDWKTSKRLYPTVFLQLAAYQQAYQEEHPGQQILQRVAVNIGRDGELTVESRDNATFERDLRMFLALLEVWHWDRENNGKWSKPALQRIGPKDLQHILTQ